MNDTLPSPATAPTLAPRWAGLTTPPSGARRPIVVVLGMHRSGTSLCAHVLSALGVDMADEIDAHPSNLKGHWERREIVAFHDRILDHFNRAYYSPYHDFGLPVAWWADPRVGEVRREIVAFLAARMHETVPFGFKDPRTVRLLPMWHQIFAELELEPKIVFCLRNPAQVARSLSARDGLDADIGELRWFAYVTDFFRHTKSRDIGTIEYESWFADPAATLARLRNLVGPVPLDRELDVDALLAGIVDDGLRHDERRHRRARLPLVRSLYALARRADRDLAARDEILTIATQYVGFDQLQAAFHHAFERNTAAAQRVPGFEREVAALREVLAEREAALAAAASRAAEGEVRAEESAARAEENAARERAAVAALDRQRVLTSRQRIAAQLEAAEAVHAEVARLRAALAAAEREARQSRSERDDADGALIELSETLADAQRFADEARTARQRESRAAVAIADLEVRLAARAAEAEARRNQIEQMRGEADRLRAAVAGAERLAAEIEAAGRRELAATTAHARELAVRLAEETAAAEAAAARENTAQSEIDRQRASLGELTRQRDAAELAVSMAQADIARLRAALDAAEASRAGDEGRDNRAESDAAAAATATIADLTVRLAEQSRQAAAAERALQARIDALHAQLATAADARLQPRSGWARRLAGAALRRRADAAVRAGELALRAGEMRQAARHFRRALDRSPPGSAATWERLGRALEEAGDSSGAEAAYRRALALDGRAAEAQLQLARLLKQQSRWAEAADAYVRALQLDPGLAPASAELDGLCPQLLAAGDKARDARDWSAAAASYRRLLDRRPGLAAIWVQLGHAEKEQGDYSAAEVAYRRSLALEERVADTHLQLGRLLTLAARWEEAADAYARAHALDPAAPQLDDERGELCRHLVAAGDKARSTQDWPAAARLYRRALAEEPGLVSAWQRLGEVLGEAGELAAAEAACRRALALDASNAETSLQLGHLLQRQGQHRAAIDAYATAVRLDPELPAARDALRTATVAAAAATPVSAGPATEAASPVLGAPGHDVIWLGVIDWHYRIQRPQHLAANLADTGGCVFYISLVFEPSDGNGRFRIVQSPRRGVFEVRVRMTRPAAENLYRGLGKAAVGEVQLALDELIAVLGLRAPVVVVDHPAWHPVACGVPGATVVYDCLDLATGFSTAAASTASFEAAMLADSDLVIAASKPLVAHIAQQRPGVLVRNAADVELFADGFTERLAGEWPVVGYFGAIAEWFNIAWIEECARARPDWDFRLVGRTDGCNIGRAAALPNVHFLGEMPYPELPRFLREVDVAVIPFKMIELIRCTNPVKLYEYMAAGKAVVAAPMPEVIEASDLVYIAEDAPAFAARIAEALAEDSPALRLRRVAWARQHTWPRRAREMQHAIDASLPLVSVVVLTYNNWDESAACLESLDRFSDYRNLEIIVVDNASTDGTPDGLRRLAAQDERLRVVLNETNLGVAGGYNTGLRLARGEFVILLNNDTIVTRGWVRDLIRPMQRDPKIGMTGPLTNAIGNEQKVKPAYHTIEEMHEWARRFVRRRLRRIFEVDNLAFFCVAIRRSVLDEVGLIDEAYGLGFFEDDDYSRRVRQAGYRLVVADDVFVHHQLSLSFSQRGREAHDELMARNRTLFEERWGPWQPHRYRDEPGFG